MLISGKYYLIEQDERFPLQPTGEWQSFLNEKFEFPCDPSIYLLSGCNNLYVGLDMCGGRVYGHRKSLSRGRSNQYLQQAYDLNGLSGFFYQSLVVLPTETILYIDLIENAYIKHFDTYKNGYNVLEFSQGPCVASNSRKVTLISKEGIVATEKSINVFSRKYNLSRSEITKVLDGKTKHVKGWTLPSRYSSDLSYMKITHSPDVIKKRAETQRGQKRSKEAIENLKKGQVNHAKDYSLLNIETLEVCIGKNMLDFSKSKNLKSNCVSRLVLGKRRSYKNWVVYDPKITIENHIKKLKQRNSSKIYLLISPGGRFIIVKNLTEFCRKNNLNNVLLFSTRTNRINNHCGWILLNESQKDLNDYIKELENMKNNKKTYKFPESNLLV